MHAPGRPQRIPQRILVLFEKEWDAGGLAPLVNAREIEVFHEGFDLFRFPENARLLAFDAWRFIDRICAKYRGRIDGVISGDEQFGALIAAIVAERLGLPGNDPRAIARAQHKLLLRRIQREATPAAAVRCAPLPFALDDPRVRDPGVLQAALGTIGRDFPLFVKPVKATYSVLARRIERAADLASHCRFGAFERLVIAKLVAPYAAMAARYIEMPCDPTALVVEDCVEGHQLNLDGYAVGGDIRIAGLVDEWMYAGRAGGARHFLRFGYPSAAPDEIRERVIALSTRLLRAIGFRQGFFNVELFLTPDGDLRFIEINPRLAVQFVGLYRDVAGLDVHRMMVAMATGRDPDEVPRLPRRASVGASFVFRRFDGRGAPPPEPSGVDWLRRHHPTAELTTYAKRGKSLAREYKWLGSHRYGVLNLSAADDATLERAYTEACERLGWPAEAYRPEHRVEPFIEPFRENAPS